MANVTIVKDKTLFIVNPISGGVRGTSRITAISEALSRSGAVETIFTSQRGDAERIARNAAVSGYKRVVAAGGDGTINEIANGLAGSPVECGIIPVGTANVLARDLGLPLNDPEAAADIINQGITRNIDLGRAGDRYFAAMAGFGFDAAVVNGVTPRTKSIIGPGAYVLSIAEELVRGHSSRFRLQLDAETLEVDAFLIVAANTPSYAYGVALAPQASLESGLLHVIIFEKTTAAKLGLLHQAAEVLMHTHTRDPNIICLDCRKITITSEPEVLVQLDGDPAGRTPATLQIAPQALTVLVPEGVEGTEGVEGKESPSLTRAIFAIWPGRADEASVMPGV